MSLRLGRTSIVDVGEAGTFKARNVAITDPRVLGLTIATLGTMFHHRIDELVATDRSEPVLEMGQFKGEECCIVRYEQKSRRNVKRSVWILPAKDFSVVRVESEGTSDQRQWKCTFESDLKQYGKQGIWYPKSGTYVDINSQTGEVFQKETINVLDASLNEAVAPEVFSLDGMGIPEGTLVRGSAFPAGQHIWDGRKVVRDRDSEEAFAAGPKVSPLRPFDYTRLLLNLSAGLLLLCGFGALVLRLDKAAFLRSGKVLHVDTGMTAV